MLLKHLEKEGFSTFLPVKLSNGKFGILYHDSGLLIMDLLSFIFFFVETIKIQTFIINGNDIIWNDYYSHSLSTDNIDNLSFSPYSQRFVYDEISNEAKFVDFFSTKL